MRDEERIRKFIEQKIEQRNGLLVHLAIYVAVNGLVLLNWLNEGIPKAIEEFRGPLIMTFLWGIGMVAHFLDYSNKYGNGRDRRERLIQRELEKERARLSSFKAKNDDFYYDDEDESPIRLTEDGELTDSYVEEVERQRR